MKKKKLELKKKVIASLSDSQKSKIMGGEEAAYTTSFTNCTNFLCCGNFCSVEPTCGGEQTCDSCEMCDTLEMCPATAARC